LIISNEHTILISPGISIRPSEAYPGESRPKELLAGPGPRGYRRRLGDDFDEHFAAAAFVELRA
jgi:hypothetical protein